MTIIRSLRKISKRRKLLQIYGLSLLIFIKITSTRRRKVWTRPWLTKKHLGLINLIHSEFAQEDHKEFKKALRMNECVFEKLLSSIKPYITKQNTVMRESISARAKLSVTLRFLATGETYRSLMYSFRIHESTISRFVPEVCGVIYKVLKEKYLKVSWIF